MHYNKNNKFAVVIGIVFLFISSTAYSVGFGKIKVYSYLNELLSAEIELLGVENINTDLLIANLANSKDFLRANMARPYFLTKLTFEVIRYEDRSVIYISSTKPVKNPFLDFLVELSWPDGKLVKGYTILIDPPPKNGTLRPSSLKKQKALLEESNNFDYPNSVEVNPIKEESLLHVSPSLPAQQKINKQVTEQTEYAGAKANAAHTNKGEESENAVANIPKTVVLENENNPALNQKANVKEEPSKQNTVQELPATTQNSVVSSINPEQPMPAPRKISEKNKLLNDNSDVAGALSDNIKVNKSEQNSGILDGLITTLKNKPLFSPAKIDSNKMAENSLKPSDMQANQKNSETLEDLLTKKSDSSNTTSSQDNKKPSNATISQFDAMDAALDETFTKKNNAAKQTKAANSEGTQISNLAANAENKNAEHNNTLHKKYGFQLILSFAMVLVTVIFLLKILRRSNSAAQNNEQINSTEQLPAAKNVTTIHEPNNNKQQFATDLEIEDDDFATTSFTDSHANANTIDDLDLMEFDDEYISEMEDMDTAIADMTTKAQYGDFAHELDSAPISRKNPTEYADTNIELSSDDFNLPGLDKLQNSKHIASEREGAAQGYSNDKSAEPILDLLADNKKEVNLKISLAKQYLDAGDTASSKALLDEILAIADKEQNLEIELLLKSIANSKVVS